jgi:CRISPR-associated protein Cas1
MLSLPDYIEKSVIICFPCEGHIISFKNDNLIIKDKEDKILLQTTCHKIFSLFIVGHVTLTSGILEKSKKFGFSIYLLSYYFRPIGMWCSKTEGNFLLRKKQYDYNNVDIAKHITHNKISNQIELLKSIRNKSEKLKININKIEQNIDNINNVDDYQTLLGIEGSASRIFFGEWFEDLNWIGRKPRTKIDPINTLMDIGYTFLFNMIESMLNLYGFDVYYGVYHKNFYQRKSLVCDIIEPFRSIVDKHIKSAYNLGQFKLDDFNLIKNQYFLKQEKNKEYTQWLLQSILKYKEDVFSYVQNYYRCFIRNKDINNYPTFKINI